MRVRGRCLTAGTCLTPAQMLESQVDVRQREVVELQTHVKALGQEVKDTDEVDGRRQVVEKKFQDLLEPLRRRRDFLVASREVHQFNRDVEDEIVRIPTETLPHEPNNNNPAPTQGVTPFYPSKHGPTQCQ